ncbi:MAG: formylglycine-generating enzyme family protein [Candidatus Solibacter usitatus]|nr:formylglycine-generating enzyme family protein [Candidatus Solibacter usitatus]
MRKLSLSALASLSCAAVLFSQQAEMVRIPASACTIGATTSHEEIHKEQVAAFSIAKTPVTNAQYKDFVDATGHPAPERNSIGSKFHLWNGNAFPPEIAEQPVVNVSWNDVTAYCAWLSKKSGKTFRLPTEEEWEIAARGGQKGKLYPWGDKIDSKQAWFGGKWNGLSTLRPAGYGEPNAFGLLGMAGNVWQWTADWYVPVFNGRPVEEELKLFRVIRGGSWANEAEFLKVNYRNFHPPDFKDLFLGFRVATSVD